MTFLQLINKVLRGLREPQAASLTGEHTALIGQLVNEAKEDIEDLGPWRALRTIVDINTVADSSTGIALTGANERSYLLYQQANAGQAFIVTADNERRLQVISRNHHLSLDRLYPDADHAVPVSVSFAKNQDGMNAHFWPVPDAVYAARFDLIIPQAELTSATTELQIPSRPVWQEALARAMEERGEEFSGSLDAVRGRAARSLESAMLADFGVDPLTFTPE